MKKIKISFFFLFLFVVFLPQFVWAKEITFTIEKNELTINDTVEVKASLPKDTKAYGLVATFAYDEKVFEELEETSFKKKDPSMDITYNPKNHKFGILNPSGAIENELFSITLKVKEDAKVGETNIALTNLSSSDGKKSEKYSDVILKVTVTRDAKENETVPIPSPNEILDSKENEIFAFTNMPILVVLSVVTLLCLVIAILIGMKRPHSKKALLCVISFIFILLVLTGILIFKNEQKKDLNQDGKKDYEDAKEIIKYLIDMEGRMEKENSPIENPSKENSYYDYNNDGKVDVNDVGSATEEVTEKTKYKVSLEEIGEESSYVSKNNITLSFHAKIEPNSFYIKEVKIDGIFYPVVKEEDFYTVTIDSLFEAGVHDFHITSVLLNNGKEVQAKCSFRREFLKDIPYITKFQYVEEENLLTFELIDPDHAWIDGEIRITNSKEEEIVRQKIEEKTKVTYSFMENESYHISILATYDLDSNAPNEFYHRNDNYYENIEIFSHPFMVGGNYDFQISDVFVTDAIQKGEKPILTFKSENNYDYLVETVVINDKEYKTTLMEDGTYEVILEDFDSTSTKIFELNIQSIALDNFKVFENKKDFSLPSYTIYVLKNAPTVEEIELKNNPSTKTIETSYLLKDSEETIQSLTAVLKDSTGKTVDSKEIHLETLEPIFLSYEGNNDGFYTVHFLAHYNLGNDKYEYKNENIGSKDILTQEDIYVKNVIVNNKYPKKGEKPYQISYEIYVGDSIKEISKSKYGVVYNTVSSITINGLNYNAIRENDNFTSKITLTVPNEAGILDLKATKVQLQFEDYNRSIRDFYSIPTETTQIDVLKEQPKIENLKVIEEDYEKEEVTFEFDVAVDHGGYQSGYVKLDEEKMEMKEGKNTVTFHVKEKDQPLPLTFFASYDLDSNVLEEKENQNVLEENKIYETSYGLYSNEVYERIQLKNTKVLSKKNNSYFEKKEKIPLTFEIEGISDFLLKPTKIKVEDKEYPIYLNEDHYEVELDGYPSSGRKTLTITEILFENGQSISLKKPSTVSLEVLKDIVKVKDYTYDVQNDEFIFQVNFDDPDSSLTGNQKIVVTTEDDIIIAEDTLKEEFRFDKLEDEKRYWIEIYSSYDRDMNQSEQSENHVSNALLFEEMISLDEKEINLEEIEDAFLYYVDENSKTYLKEEINRKELENHLDSYFVELKVKNMPTIRSKIKRITVENEHLILILDSQYTHKKDALNEEIRIDFGPIEKEVAKNEMHPETFEELMKRLKANLNREIVLTQDYDASGCTLSDATYLETWKGTLDGNGHKIQNLTKPLFQEIDHGTVKNLTLENVELTSTTDKGSLSNVITGATIENVLVNKVTKTNTAGHQNGGLVGLAKDHSLIRSSRVKNISLNFGGYQQSGGLVGALSHSTIQNSYAIGTIDAYWNFIGGLVGAANQSEIVNSYASVKLGGAIACDFACSTEGGTIFKNNFAISSNASNGFVNNYKSLENNYLIMDSLKESAIDGLAMMSKEEVNESFFEKTLEYDESIWYINHTSATNLPIFQIERMDKDYKEEEKYDESKTILYQNLKKFMPFYNEKQIIESGDQLDGSHLLNQEEIVHLIPVDETGNIVTYLDSSNPKKIKKLRIVLKSGQKLEYSVRYEGLYDMIASYRIADLKIDYQYQNYVIQRDAQIIMNLTNYLSHLNYEDQLDPLTSTSDSRILKDFYKETTQKELTEFLLKYLSNSDEINTTNEKSINDYLERKIKTEGNIEKVLYVYNYLRRFYDLEVDGMKLYDFLLFKMEGFDSTLTAMEIANLYLKDSNHFLLNQTSDQFRNVFGTYTNFNNVKEFLEYMVTHFSSKSMSEWTASQYKGILVEIPVEGHEEVQYTLWDHFSTPDIYGNWYNYILPILTLPKNSSYIISSPVQYIIGSQKTYIQNPEDPSSHQLLIQKINSYTSRMKTYYDTAYKIIEDKDIFNRIHTLQIDKRYAYDENGVLTFQTPYTTEEPFHKNFNEVVGQWAYNDYNAATANGLFVIWRVEGLMDGNLIPSLGNVLEYTFHTWSHESAHNIDSRLFLKAEGRRFDAGGEDYADGNLTQSFGSGDIVMNLSKHYELGDKIGSNLDPSRINSKTKIQDFYEKVFDTLYLMDYLEGQSFLKLSPEYQSKIAVQVMYPYEDTYVDEYSNYLRYKTTVYHEIDTKEFEEMKLDSIEDLYDNRLVIFPGVIYSTYGANRYGGENIFKTRWYQPHNDYGRPDSYSLKWLAYEMLGYAGYEKGYIEYYSNIHSMKKEIYANPDEEYKKDPDKRVTKEVDYKTDLMALQQITGYDSFETYKKDRFKKVEEKLAYVHPVIPLQEYYEEFYEALCKDAEAVKQKQEEAKMKYPLDTKEHIDARNKMISDSKVKNFKYSTEVREKLYHTLKTQTHDFEDEIYLKEVQQSPIDFDIIKK